MKAPRYAEQLFEKIHTSLGRPRSGRVRRNLQNDYMFNPGDSQRGTEYGSNDSIIYFYATDNRYINSIMQPKGDSSTFEPDFLDIHVTYPSDERKVYFTDNPYDAFLFAKDYESPAIVIVDCWVIGPPEDVFNARGVCFYDQYEASELVIVGVYRFSGNDVEHILRQRHFLNRSRDPPLITENRTFVYDPIAHQMPCQFENKGGSQLCRNPDCQGRLPRNEPRFKFYCTQERLSNGMYGARIEAYYHPECILRCDRIRPNLVRAGKDNLVNALASLESVSIENELKEKIRGAIMRL